MTPWGDFCVSGTILFRLSNLATDRLYLTERHTLRVISEQTPTAFRRTQKGRRQAGSRHTRKASSQIASHQPTVRDSRTLLQLSTSQNEKTSPESTRIMQSETTLCHVRAGALGGSSGRVREVWREREPSPKEGSLSLQGLPLRLQGLSHPSTASFSNPARLILCEAFFGNSSATGTKRTIRL